VTRRVGPSVRSSSGRAGRSRLQRWRRQRAAAVRAGVPPHPADRASLEPPAGAPATDRDDRSRPDAPLDLRRIEEIAKPCATTAQRRRPRPPARWVSRIPRLARQTHPLRWFSVVTAPHGGRGTGGQASPGRIPLVAVTVAMELATDLGRLTGTGCDPQGRGPREGLQTVLQSLANI